MSGDGTGSQRWLGEVLGGRYRIDAQLGQGGMGTVFRGVQLSVDRPVAIKLVAPEVRHHPELLKRFEREAQLLSRLNHPHIVSLFDYGVNDGQPYLVMELLRGVDLAQALAEQGSLSPERALHVLAHTLKALRHAHELGIVHRDLKPHNLFLVPMDGEEFVKVMDFGIARLTDDRSRSAITMTGAVLGTALYMAPEQAEGKSVDARADLYALGIILFEMLTGRCPFEADSIVSLLLQHAAKPPPTLQERAPQLSASPNLQGLLDRLLAKLPDDRPASAEAALALVEAVRAEEAGYRLSDPSAGIAHAATALAAEGAGTFSSPRATHGRPSLTGSRWGGLGLLAFSLVALVALGAWALAGHDPETAETTTTAAAATIATTAAPQVLAGAPLPAEASARPEGGAQQQVAQAEPPAQQAPPTGHPAPASPKEAAASVDREAAASVDRSAVVEALPKGETPPPARTTKEAAARSAPAAQGATAGGAQTGSSGIGARRPTRSGVQSAAASRSTTTSGPAHASAPRAPSEPAAAAQTRGTAPPPARTPPPTTPSPPSAAPIQRSGFSRFLSKVGDGVDGVLGIEDRRERRHAMLARGPSYPNVASAKAAYRSGRIDRQHYEDTIWVLKTQRKQRLQQAKADYRARRIDKAQYQARVRQIDRAYEGP